MPDMKKIIKTIEGCINDDSFCNKCDYDGCVFQYGGCEKDLLADALALIKEQQQQIWEFQDQVEYLTDKLKEQETELCDRCGWVRLKSSRIAESR